MRAAIAAGGSAIRPCDLELDELAGDPLQRALPLQRLGVIEGDVVAGAREDDRPAGADQPGADQRDPQARRARAQRRIPVPGSSMASAGRRRA